jgi:hypothetical protein
MITDPTLLAILKADILADPAFVGQFAEQIAAAYNQPAAPEWIVWKTSVDVDEIMRNGMDWTQVDNLTVGKARIWDWMTRLGSFNASKTNIRAGIDAAWVGTAAMLAVRAIIYTHCKRAATRGEKLLSTGTGSTASPATMRFEGVMTYQDVEAAQNLP